ncbi:dTDP-4-dehydrorhamnose 3,5-epimerase [Tepiditoga spiralis]|uniref:dTDP-4-dehydrorhamnose 3,5-epimerase n=1 Tax=Tepiditoga spiralis TaxID=2108365 RepID=A0A7G1G691_9BACT|nr:dTDP-4-dehydrorhamnose 3,5-epimerase [Tepiditoga spiralis]BBE30323.1 dTDP-4-dehydrorhamnose 3,5-epimerase [Tepiditoga spiralis]
MFDILKTNINGVYILKPKVFKDNRGFFMESWNKKDFFNIGIKKDFVQDNHVQSKKGVLRGLHFQTKHKQGKLIRCINGKIYDISVDLRKNSKTFGKYFSVLLSDKNKNMLYIPEEFAHGYLVLSDKTEILYKTTDYYYPEYESGIIWNDKTLNINWNLDKYKIKKSELILSSKDQKLPDFNEYLKIY